MNPLCLWSLGRFGLSHWAWPWIWFDCMDPSLGVCITGLWLSLRIWKHPFASSGWWPWLCRYLWVINFSCLEHCCGGGCIAWHLYMHRNCIHMVGHEIVALEAYCPCILFGNQWDFDGDAIIWVHLWWHNLCVIWDDMWHHLGWLPWCVTWDHCNNVIGVHSLIWISGQVCRYCHVELLHFTYPLSWCRCLFYPWKFLWGVGCTCHITVLKMSDNCQNAVVFLLSRCGIGIEGVRFYTTSVRSSDTCITEYIR